MSPVLAACLVAALAVSGSAQEKAEEKKEQKKLDKQERQDFDALVAAVDAVVGGQPAATGIDITWTQNHFIKAMQNKAYVPFTIGFDPATITTPSVALYVRLMKSGGAAPTATDGDTKKPVKLDPATFAWENVHFFEVPKPASDAPPGSRVMVSRAFTAEGGDYDLYLGVRERTAGKKGVTPKMTVLKQPLSIPNFYDNELTTSSIILAARAEPLTTPIPPDQQLDNAYTLGTMRLTPSLDNKFAKASELNVYFWIYNPSLDAAKKPDISVEYAFHQKTGETEKYFNKTNPLRLNGQSLQPDFDLEAGHQLNGGQSIRLASFPEGDYRLEIKVTDNLSKKTVSRDIKFTVSP